nr:facilitated trehalose transporter Tret1-like [Penaeus vannamei]
MTSEVSKGGHLLETPAEKRRRIGIQVLMVLAACLGHSVIAIVAAFPNPAISDLRKDNSTIFGSAMALTTAEMDMMGSLVCAGTIPGTWLGGWMVGAIGRRKSLILIVVPFTLAWALVGMAVNPPMMLVGRFISGICYGVTTVAASTYVIEIPDASFRGAMAALPTLFFGLGLVATVTAGMFLRWYAIALVGYAVMVLCSLLMFFLPETPAYLAVSGDKKKAGRILEQLRGPDFDVDQELKTLRECNETQADETFVRQLLKPEMYRPLIVCIVLFFIQNFSGLTVMYYNTTRIFHAAGSTIDEDVATIYVFFVKLLGTIIACLFLDRIGRRVCMILSLLIMGVCLVIMGVYLNLKEGAISGFEISDALPAANQTLGENPLEDEVITRSHEYLPLLCLMVYMFASCIGAHPVPWILSTEYFPTTTRGQASGLCAMACSLFNFAALQLFSPMLDALSQAGLYWAYGAVSFLGVLFCLVCVKETKGKSVG